MSSLRVKGGYSVVAFFPRVVRAKPPDVPLEVAASVAASAVILVLDVQQDLRACRFRTCIMCVDYYVGAFTFGAADFVRMLHQAVELAAARFFCRSSTPT